MLEGDRIFQKSKYFSGLRNGLKIEDPVKLDSEPIAKYSEMEKHRLEK